MEATRLMDTPLIILPDMSNADIDALAAEAWARTCLLQRVLDGKASWEEYLEMLFEHGIDSEEAIETAQNNLSYAITEGMWIEL